LIFSDIKQKIISFVSLILNKTKTKRQIIDKTVGTNHLLMRAIYSIPKTT
jgi:hypothetical protein